MQLTYLLITVNSWLIIVCVVRLSHHILHTVLLPPPSTASQNYNLRHRTHSLDLPAHTTHLTDCTFRTEMYSFWPKRLA